MELYQQILRPLLFSGLKADPETVTQQTLATFNWLDHHRHQPPSSWILKLLQRTCCLEDPRLTQTLWGLHFPNPVGLAAGLDKDGLAAGIWSSLGFGFAEVGTVTAHPQPGNPKPRLFRLPEDQAAINRMGFNNQGAAALARQLQEIESRQSRQIPLGINLGKSRVTPLQEAQADYLQSFQELQAWGDYFVLNVSSPNTPGLRDLQTASALSQLLIAMQDHNSQKLPLLVKVSPDLSWQELDEIIAVALDLNLSGIIATNTTTSRDHLRTQIIPSTGRKPDQEGGGVSGAPLRHRSTEVIRFIYRSSQGQIPIVGVGGIFTAADAWEKICAGASLIQVYTGWAYEGPLMVRRILKGLLERMEAKGYRRISEAVGSEAV